MKHPIIIAAMALVILTAVLTLTNPALRSAVALSNAQSRTPSAVTVMAFF